MVTERAMPEPGGYSLYEELAEWWPVISPAVEYADDAAVVDAIFGSAAQPVRSILDLGCGGGHVARYLKDARSMTLVDRSAEMLEVSRQLNPDCEHLEGDMRTIRLGRQFDAVLVHDAVDYVTNQGDLSSVIATAFAHCRPGGLAIFAPDHTAETFRAGRGGGGGSDGTGRQASFRERTSDPVPDDDWILAEYEFTLRDASGSVRVVPEAHQLGSFRRDTWLRLLRAAGFAGEARHQNGNGAAAAKVLFIGRRDQDPP
jgi:SAM-dependent methyltransferase